MTSTAAASVFNRRQVLRLGAGATALGALGSTAARADPPGTWGRPDPSIYPASFFPAGKTFYKILEIHLYGGLSPWETFYHRPLTGGRGYRGFETGASEVVTALNWHNNSGSTPNLCHLAPVAGQTQDFAPAGSDAVHFGPSTKPLWDTLLDRTRLVVLQHNLLPHEAAIPYVATGSKLGQPQFAGLGAAIQHRAIAVEEAMVANPALRRSTPWSYVLEPSAILVQDNLDAFKATGQHPGSSKPITLIISGGGLVARLQDRPNIRSTAQDQLLRFYRDEYDRMLRFPGHEARARSIGFDNYLSSLNNTLNADLLATQLGGAIHPVGDDRACVSADPLQQDAAPNQTAAGLRSAARLLSNPATPAHYVCVIDAGLIRAPGGGAYDTHATVHSSVTATNLWNVLATLRQLIDAGDLDLNTTLVVLTTEFGRTPYRSVGGLPNAGSDGRDHWPQGFRERPDRRTRSGAADSWPHHGRRFERRLGSRERVRRSFQRLQRDRRARRRAAGRWHRSLRQWHFRRRRCQPLARHRRRQCRYRPDHRQSLLPVRLAMAPMRNLKIACGLLLLLATGACAPEVRKSDDGHHAWARQVVVTLFGRQPAGEAEVRVIADAAALVGRRKAAEALMGSSEFNAYWSDLLVDFVRAPREDAKDLSACVGTPLRAGAPTAALAAWVKANAATSTGAPGGAFNLADLLASSMAADDLSPFLRGYVFAAASQPLFGDEVSELNKREDLYNVFEGTLLGRNSTCLACHNAAWSMTGPQTGWNRTYSPLGYFERSLFGAHEGSTSPNRVKAVFRVRDVIGAGSAPWGMSDCGTFSAPTTDDFELAAGEQAYLAGDQGRRASVFTVEQLFRSGIGNLTNGLNRSVSPVDRQACAVCGSCPAGAGPPPTDAAQQAREEAVRNLFRTEGCLTCHTGGAGGLRMRDDPTFKDQLVRVASRNGPPLPRVEPGHAENSFLVNALVGFTRPDGSTFTMPPGGPTMDAASVDVVRAWINGLSPAAGCTTCAGNSPGLSCPAPWATVPGDEALAYLIALNLVDKVWMHVTGRPLTLAHHFSRNRGQRDLLWHLAEVEFVANTWSLKKLLGFILASDYYSRRPPEDGDGANQPNGAKSPYELPMFYDPWVEQDPRVSPATDPGYVAGDHPAKHANAMSEAVERKPAVTLLRSVGSALGWPQPQRTPSPFDYPSRDLVANLGQFLRDAVPGFRGENFSAFLEWESEVARCRKPDKLVDTDWIDRLEAAIRDHNTANPADHVTVAQAAEIVKDWLLADGRMSAPERTLWRSSSAAPKATPPRSRLRSMTACATIAACCSKRRSSSWPACRPMASALGRSCGSATAAPVPTRKSAGRWRRGSASQAARRTCATLSRSAPWSSHRSPSSCPSNRWR